MNAPPTLREYRAVANVYVSLDERAGVLVQGSRVQLVSPRCARFLRTLLDRSRTCPNGTGAVVLMKAVWPEKFISGDQLRSLHRVAAEARDALQPFGLSVERFRTPGVADWPGYRLAKLEEPK